LGSVLDDHYNGGFIQRLKKYLQTTGANGRRQFLRIARGGADEPEISRQTVFKISWIWGGITLSCSV
jgi:hypothetical protein